MKNEVEIRELVESDIATASDLLLRLKKLNGEFDSAFNVSEKASADASEHLKLFLKDKTRFMTYVAEKQGKVIGIIALNFIKRLYYVPETEARIIEFYVMPESRRTGAGKLLIDTVYKELAKRKIVLVTAEFPALNPIALSFYEDLGFREMIGVYGKML